MSKKYFVLVALCVLAMTGSAFGQNLLLNAGFETWTAGAAGPPDNWYSSSGSLTGSQEAVIVNSGTYSCNLTWTTTSTVYFIQDVAVTAGLDYTFSFMAYDNDTGGRLRNAVRWFQADNTTFISGYYGDYTTDATTWQALSSGPQTAPAGAAFAHVEIRVYDIAGWPGTATCYADDAIFEEAVAPEPDTLTIYEIQYTTDPGTGSDCFPSPHDGEIVVTKGVVTAVNTKGTYPNFWIQEAEAAWSGVFVFDSAINPAVGDEVQIKCEVDDYYGLTELKNVTEYAILSTGNVVNPIVITTCDLSAADSCAYPGEPYEGVLVKVLNPWVTSLGLYGQFYICDTSCDAEVDDDLMVYTVDPGNAWTFIQGVVDYSYDQFELLPRDEFDFGMVVAVELTSFEAVAGDGQVTLAWQTASEVETHSFNIYRDGQKVASVPAFGDAHNYNYVDRDLENGTTYSYQLSDVDLSGFETMHPMVCSVTPNAVPGAYALNQNYPNPFNPSTEISYAIPAETHVTMTIYNLLGQEIATLVDEVKEAGQHAVSWNAADNASGVYFYHLQTNDFSATKKMVFMK